MDAVTLVAAAVAVACDQSRTAALEEVLRDRELAAMRAADLECQVAQRGHVWSQQLPRPAQLPLHAYERTWQQAYNELDTEYQNALNALQAVGVANANGDSNRVAELVRQELGAAPMTLRPRQALAILSCLALRLMTPRQMQDRTLLTTPPCRAVVVAATATTCT